jgi:hypothetical protein
VTAAYALNDVAEVLDQWTPHSDGHGDADGDGDGDGDASI